MKSIETANRSNFSPGIELTPLTSEQKLYQILKPLNPPIAPELVLLRARHQLGCTDLVI